MNISIVWLSIGYVLLAELLCLPFSYLLSRIVNFDETTEKKTKEERKDKTPAKNGGNLSIVTKGILKENPVFVLVLGTCPTLAVTNNVFGAFGMGIAAMLVLICSNMLISALRKVIPDSVRIPSYIVIIAGFVTIVQMVVKAFLPDLDKMLGVYLPLIVVNCVILGRAEMFAGKNSVGKSALDGVGMGLGFTLALVSMAIVREVLGAATFAADSPIGFAIPFLEPYKITFLSKAPGGLLVYGLLIAVVYIVTNGKAPKKRSFSCEGCPTRSTCNPTACGGEKEEA